MHGRSLGYETMWNNNVYSVVSQMSLAVNACFDPSGRICSSWRHSGKRRNGSARFWCLRHRDRCLEQVALGHNPSI